MKLTILEWEDLIMITGGCLAPDKSAWYLVDHEWIEGKRKCTNPGQEKIMKATNKAKVFFPLWYL